MMGTMREAISRTHWQMAGLVIECRCEPGAKDQSRGAGLALTYEANTTCHKDLAALLSTIYTHADRLLKLCVSPKLIPEIPPPQLLEAGL